MTWQILTRRYWTLAVVWLRQGKPEKPDDITHHESQPNLVGMKKGMVGFGFYTGCYKLAHSGISY